MRKPRIRSRCRKVYEDDSDIRHRDGKSFLSPGNKQVTLDELPSKVQDLLTNKLDKTVYIRADARSKYQSVEDVVTPARRRRVDQLGLITETQLERHKPLRLRFSRFSVR